MQPQTIHRYRAGMPQLAHAGLSENWLLKECGHRHWEALARATGREIPEFIDDNGERAYAAFTAVSVDEAELDRFTEHDTFDIETTLCRSGAARHYSVHNVFAGKQARARISMSSVFVRREEAGNNQSVIRARFAALDLPTSNVPDDAAAVARIGKALRAGRWHDELAMSQPKPCSPMASEFIPCPNNDFNGAEFLYFANFQAFTDRAEWQWHRFSHLPALERRKLFFYGNLNVGDALVINLIGQREEGNRITHWCEILRGSDREKIADVITVKRWRLR